MPSSSGTTDAKQCPLTDGQQLVVPVAITAATAFATYLWTKKREQDRFNEILFRRYETEKEAKSKLAGERKEAGEPPSGEVLKGLSIDKVFVWKIEDLRKRFPSANVDNIMKNSSSRPPTTIRSPVLRHASSSVGNNNGQEEETKERQRQDFAHRRSLCDSNRDQTYNKLITDDQVILASIVRKPSMPRHTVGYMRAGPRQKLHFDPAKTNAAIVTCGGLCPGLNNVVREITKTLYQLYGIKGVVYGIQGGYRGFYDPSAHLQPILLTPEIVEDIHHGTYVFLSQTLYLKSFPYFLTRLIHPKIEGGTVLGSSRGGFDLDKIVDFLKRKKVNQLYIIGGDGTHRGAFRIHEGCMERGMNVSVAGIPKTIDNDVDYIDHRYVTRRTAPFALLCCFLEHSL